MRAPRGLPAETITIYAGGFLGPFGGAMLAPLVLAVADGLETSVELVAVAITAYMVPFATLQLFSGTIGERLGAGRVVRAGYVAYGLSALLCAFAPEIWTFIVGRGLMGTANAFLSPILMATLATRVAQASLGRALGTFAAVQTAGLTMAPLLGGGIGELSWRLSFGLVAVVSLLLVVLSRGAFSVRATSEARASWRALISRWTALLALKAMFGYLGFTAIGFLVAIVCARTFGLGTGASGLVVACYGIGGVLFGRLAGATVDRFGRARVAIVFAAICVGGVCALGFAPNVWTFSLAYLGVGCAGAFVWTALNTMAVTEVPENRAGATSAYSAFKFVGVAIAPLLYLPLLDADRHLPFLAAAGFSLAFCLLLLPWLARERVSRRAA